MVAVLAAAVLVPTAAIPRAAGGGVFSVQQVQRVFAAVGVPLEREPDSGPSSPDESFVPELRLDPSSQLGVTVYRPGTAPVGQWTYVAIGEERPRFARRSNVYVVWTSTGGSLRTWEAARRALRLLRYSPADAARPQLPTIVLRPGDRVTLTEKGAPDGSEVDCANGSVIQAGHREPVAASTVVQAGARRFPGSSATTDEGPDGSAKSARLTWGPLPGDSALEFTCSAGGPSGVPGRTSHTGSSSQVVIDQAQSGFGVSPPAPPSVTGPLPPLKLARPTFTLGNEYAGVSAQTRRAMLGNG